MKIKRIFKLLTGALLALSVVFDLPAVAQPWGSANVIPLTKGFSYTVQEVYFLSPQTFKVRYDKIERSLTAIKVTVRGKDFREGATGPVLWFNQMPANIVRVADNGLSMEAYFYRPFPKIEREAKRLRKWEVVYQQHYRSGEAFVVPPREKPVKPSDYYLKPQIKLLTAKELLKVQKLEREFKIVPLDR